jgi:hypothetical protein
VIRLAGGVVAGRGLRVWAPGPVDAAVAPLPAGAPVAIGPADASRDHRRKALAELADLVAAAGEMAAGAGVDLGNGFRSARLAGASGERRDAILAALPYVGASSDRLGPRGGVMVALFGPAVTKPCGAAAAAAVEAGQWGALRLASAASDVLGPEQLEKVLALRAPDGVDPVPHGFVADLAEHLSVVLGPLRGPRRLALLVDLWERVCADLTRRRRVERLAASQGRQNRRADIRRRREIQDDDDVLRYVRAAFGREPTLAEAARWVPHYTYWLGRLRGVLNDALCATLLLRLACDVCDGGVEDALTRRRPEIALLAGLVDPQAAGRARRKVAGVAGIPAWPGCYVRDLDARLRSRGPFDARTAQFVTQRLALARDFGFAILSSVEDLLGEVANTPAALTALQEWAAGDLSEWRDVVGYSEVRPPQSWEQPPLGTVPRGATASLAERLRDQPDAAPASVETVGDVLWCGELGDALAQLNGYDAAKVEYSVRMPWMDVAPAPAGPEPLVPGTDSIGAALAGAAQLVSFGATPPAKCRTWTELVDGLLADAAVAEALTGGFPVPPHLLAADGTTLPGTGLRIEVARNARTLAEWAQYMGNCIGGLGYVEEALQGRCLLMALRDESGHIVANLDIGLRTRHWWVHEFKERFNAVPSDDLDRAVRAWVATLPVPPPSAAAVQPRPHGGRVSRGRRPAVRLVREVAGPLVQLVEQELGDPATARALTVYAGLTGSNADLTAVGALRRLGATSLLTACRDTLQSGQTRLLDLWTASGVRPLSSALRRLDPDIIERYDQLPTLLVDQPLLGSLRSLARRPAVAGARTVDLVGRRVRVAIGALARAADPVLTAMLATDVSTDLLCALVLAVTTDGAPGPTLPIPHARTSDGPWQAAHAPARELVTDPERLDAQIAAGGLLVPTAWLGQGGWPALWQRAARSTH